MTSLLEKPAPASRSAAAPESPRETRRAKRHTGLPPGEKRSTVLTVALWVAAGYFLLPLFWLVVSSTKDNSGLFSSFGLWFDDEFHLFDNLATLFTQQNGVFVRWIGNTVLYAGVSAVGAAFLAAAAGYAFAKYSFRGKKLLFAIVLGSIMIPTTALAIPTYLLFAEAGLTNTAWAIIVPSLVSPFGVYLMRIYAEESIPDSLIEAARIDGAGEFRIFAQIGLRIMVPGFITVLLFALVATWNNYFLPLIMLSDPSLFPLTLGLAQLQAASEAGGGASAQFSTVITGSLVSILPLMIAFLYLQRYWQSGLTTGGTKE
ncbi:carbohydrate ABC transporter permease [Herbiconiux moechotypicola]|uniref:Carbohydrate ABC transporter permease n=1 Tax=Herbiconiux moechotypicola TaxID=637393 RepID=A0ABN3DBP5_9MICO|nr:carbohydrate ABC transporter permease [Herbiconiux moechotypicola]MCS5728826.1 carbohydrate ABC transporter permease [Herbiconiux moechotypicola]